MRMTDQELAEFLGIADTKNWRAVVAKIPAEKRQEYDALRDAEVEITLWQKGILPKPKHMLID